MPANGRWDLIRRLKVKANINSTLTSTLRQNLALRHNELHIQLKCLPYDECFLDRREACGTCNGGVSETTLGTA